MPLALIEPAILAALMGGISASPLPPARQQALPPPCHARTSARHDDCCLAWPPIHNHTSPATFSSASSHSAAMVPAQRTSLDVDSH